MKILHQLSVSKLAPVFIRSFLRLKGDGGRPSAPLGSRLLTNPDDVFKHNMWDHVQWTEEEKENARRKVEENSTDQLPIKEQDEFDREACLHWNKFYTMHQDKFFKDRNWLFLEFPELLPLAAKDQAAVSKYNGHHAAAVPLHNTTYTKNSCLHSSHPKFHQINRDVVCSQDSGQGKKEAAPQNLAFPGQHASFRILEVGCGVGNSVFPILNYIKDTNSFLYCCDFSPQAVKLVKDHRDYNDSVCHAFVHDLCEAEPSFPFPPLSLDVILAVFVLSSIHPERIQGVISHLSTYLKHRGIFLFRDYGRYDLTQLRFKKGQCVSDSFYMRGDGTCVYFFTKEEVHECFTKAGLEETQNLEDRRLQVNRGRKVTMLRVWIQSKYRKPHPHSSTLQNVLF